MTTPCVSITRRKLANGKTAYRLRWIDPITHTNKSKTIGSDKKRADREAALLRKELEEGTYKSLERIPWDTFVDDHLSKIEGKADRSHAATTLKEFGRRCRPLTPKHVTYGMIESFVGHLKDKGNGVATRNKKLRYLRVAFKKAIKRGFMVVNPLDGWTWERENRKEIRVLKVNEETALLTACEELHGEQLIAFVRFALQTWGRFAEITGLQWKDVDFDERCVYFRSTKSHEDRYIPIHATSELWPTLRRLQAKTLKQGGPFAAYKDNSNFHARIWHQVIELAEIDPIGIHDLRRTGITRAHSAGVPLETVRRLAGHKNLETTAKYYIAVTRQDLRDAVEKMARAT